jgi:hypothetical protein
MNVEAKDRRSAKPLIPTRRPTTRDRILYFLGAPVLALIIVSLTLIFDWSKDTMLLAGLILGSVYVLVATPLLLGRRADR